MDHHRGLWVIPLPKRVGAPSARSSVFVRRDGLLEAAREAAKLGTPVIIGLETAPSCAPGEAPALDPEAVRANLSTPLAMPDGSVKLVLLDAVPVLISGASMGPDGRITADCEPTKARADAEPETRPVAAQDADLINQGWLPGEFPAAEAQNETMPGPDMPAPEPDMETIFSRLDREREEKSEIDALIKRARLADLSDQARERVEDQLKKIRMMAPASAEMGPTVEYVNLILDLPWRDAPPRPFLAREARAMMDAEHEGLDEVKERMIEQAAIQSRTGKAGGAVICLLGSPGVGKTSLCSSIAKALGREFVLVSLAGVREEGDLRGHARTYMGAIPGRLISELRKARDRCPLILLDEMDKISSGGRGDPAFALLEILDPSQNSGFRDRYLDLPYDLSGALFLATANSMNIHEALADRLEIIEIPGYSEAEKAKIAETHLIPRALAATGLSAHEIALPREVITSLIRTRTREAGVRRLGRVIGAVCRKALVDLSDGAPAPVNISPEWVREKLGAASKRYGRADPEDRIGVVNGLSASAAGGDLLKIECVLSPGGGKAHATGRLGETMQESVKVAHAFMRAHAEALGISKESIIRNDVHVHVPAGSIPKEGPSAGLAVVAAMVSAFCAVPARRDVALTGEVTLQGTALPIGGLKDKLLAAERGGMRTVLIPESNWAELENLGDILSPEVRVLRVNDALDVLRHALVGWDPFTDTDETEEMISER